MTKTILGQESCPANWPVLCLGNRGASRLSAPSAGILVQDRWGERGGVPRSVTPRGSEATPGDPWVQGLDRQVPGDSRTDPTGDGRGGHDPIILSKRQGGALFSSALLPYHQAAVMISEEEVCCVRCPTAIGATLRGCPRGRNRRCSRSEHLTLGRDPRSRSRSLSKFVK